MTTLSTAPRYPWTICHAVAKVFDIAELMELSDSCRHVLVSLIKKVDQNHGRSPIYARRETIANEVGKSVETVYRALRELETKQYIEAREQQKDRYGKLTDSLIVFSKQLCDLLDLPSSPSVKSDRPYNQRSSLQYLHKQSNEAVDKNKLKPKLPAQPAAKKGLPEDLAILVQQGLSQPAVFKLMGMATRAGKRLSEVVAYAKLHLSKYTSHGLYGFLVKLIQRNIDYAYIASQQREKEVMKCQAKAIQVKSSELRGKTFVSTSRSDVRYQIDRANPMYLYVFVAQGDKWKDRGQQAVSSDFMEGIESGRYRETTPILPKDWA